ncbi:non-ribosomal peptide synthetase/type I polyketide synthase [Xanthomonas arboricola]|uniref:non-ribosomal peptide synthetase/type I polyketide synthase n=1 Tax=Xanthomonas arboricola TaxID=56448 RepID=UPI000CA8A98A|nr:non-ribosomal peptide synthetase/type I polyketide synthase [Xanthomonas arboricola]SOU07152.1 non-ribosomal peptide synthetase [Xanthomonas arboricola pv. fragariae]
MQQLLAILAEKQVRIELRDGKLHVHAAPGVMTRELQHALGEHKDALIGHLQAQSALAPAENYPQAVAAIEDADQPFALNPVQHAYWFGRNGSLALGGTSTHVYMEFACRDAVDPARLSAALRHVIARHGMLRAIVDADGRQRVLPRVDPYQIQVHDLSGLDDTGTAQALAGIRKEMSELVLPSDRWPLYVIRLIRLPGDAWHLCMGWDFLTIDAWSMMIILREWARFYADPDFSPHPLQLTFRDYVLAEERCRALPSYQRARRYWLDRLDTLPGPATLPQSKARPDTRYALTRRTLKLAPSQWTQLRARARAQGITASNLLLAAFSDVLARWSGTPRFCVNLTLFNRLPLHEQANAIVGDFTTLMLVEIDASRGGSFRDRVGRVQAQCLRDMEHRQFNAVDVIRELNRGKDAALDASFPIVFTSTLMLDGSRAESSNAFNAFGPMVYGISQTPQVSLDCQVFDIGGELLVNWDASDALFQAGVLDAMFAAYATLLDTLAADDAAWDSTDPVPLPAAQAATRARANATAAATPDHCLHEPFVAEALRDPGRLAVRCGGRALSYGSLLANSATLASQLIQSGAAPGQLIGICGARGPEQVVAVMAVMLAGSAYLPVDARWPALRRDQVLAESEARIVLALPGCPDDGFACGIVRVDVRIDPDRAALTQAPPRRQSPADLAYVIFTSGSTGRPKGVVIDHRAAVNTVAHINRIFALEASDKVLAVSDLGFDLSVYDLFGTLAAGATLVVPEPSLGRDPGHWHTLIRRESVTVWNSAPQLMNMLVDFAQSIVDGAIPSLRLALLSGDWIPVKLPDRLRAIAGDLDIVSLGGATECAIWSIHFPIGAVDPGWSSIPYGIPLPNQTFHVLDAGLRAVPDWVAGDLYIGGSGLAQGYWKDEHKTSLGFLVHPDSGERLYRTGDKGRYRNDGVIEFLGRDDLQVKVRGNRVELGEISSVLAAHATVREAAVRVLGEGSNSRLVAYAVPASAGAALDESALRTHLSERLPDYMVPARILALDGLPLSGNGKVLLDSLPVPSDGERVAADTVTLPRSQTEHRIWSVWCRVLGKELLHIRANFFDVGGDSLSLVEVMNQLNLGREQPLSINALLQYTTIESLARHLDGQDGAGRRQHNAAAAAKAPPDGHDDAVAVIGMAGRFPDADNVHALWTNLTAGHCAVRQFSDAALLAAGVDPLQLAAPDYVKAGVVLAGIDRFDAGYFDLIPADAAIMDPQQRLLLECATAALDDAGYADERGGARIGAFVGKGTNFYLYEHLIGNLELARNADVIGMLSLNEADYAATLLSYKLGLTGPSLGINTACSTSLVAVHAACHSLTRSRDCEIAIAGGVTIANTVSPSGYSYVSGHITSPDGYCRAFADDAKGCVFGSGVGLVVLKPLKRAIADGDNVLAVIKATAINNDGARKLGFTAPSAQGQARAIADALEAAGCGPDAIQSIEAHGTGTALGDPIEFEGLRAVFGGPRASGERCPLGSIKTNIGHLGSAAGIAGLIKMIQSLRHRQIPPSLHAAVPSRKIDFADSPFFVNTELRDWPAPASGPRRGGVSAFGVGGTNAHVIVEEAPAAPATPDRARTARSELLVLSARTSDACRQAAGELAAALRGDTQLVLEDVAHTLQLGRKAHEWRLALVCEDNDDAVRALDAAALPLREFNHRHTPQVVLVLAGEGIARIDAIACLHRQEPAFADAFNRCAQVLLGIAAYDLQPLLTHADAAHIQALPPRQRMGLQFASEYALAQLWLSLGIKPAALLGRALGEYVAACLAAVFSLETALALVDAQARLLLPQEPEQHCTVDATADSLQDLVDGCGCRIVSVDGAQRCGVSGTAERILALSQRLHSLGIGHQQASAVLSTARAASASGDTGYAAYAQLLAQASLQPPALALVLSGNERERRAPDDRRYWERQPSNLVQFHSALQKIDRLGDPIVLSIGACAAFDAVGTDARPRIRGVAAAGDSDGVNDARKVFLQAVAALWMAGVDVDWNGLHAGCTPRRVSLPSYPFQRSRHWIERSAFNRLGAAATLAPGHHGAQEPAPATPPDDAAHVATTDQRGRIQADIAAIWEGVLGTKNIGSNDNFFDIGGKSLTATSIFARIKSEFGLELPLDKMFEFATIRQMSLYVAAKLDPAIVDRLSPQELEEMLAMTED